jgi:hypothetical protein
MPEQQRRLKAYQQNNRLFSPDDSYGTRNAVHSSQDQDETGLKLDNHRA